MLKRSVAEAWQNNTLTILWKALPYSTDYRWLLSQVDTCLAAAAWEHLALAFFPPSQVCSTSCPPVKCSLIPSFSVPSLYKLGYNTMDGSHVFQFFLSYPDFILDEDEPPTREFLRLKELNHWEDDDEEYMEAREDFANALAEDFNVTYGTDIHNIDHWHTLCHVLRIDPIPEGISACRKV